MPGFLLSVISQVQCAHMGMAKPMTPNPRVTVSGQPTVLMTSPYQIAGCTFPPPPNGNGPCVTAMCTTGTVRVTSMGQPLLVQTSLGTCVPTGTPLLIIVTQPRVSAT